MIKIEKNIPIPVYGSKTKFPLGIMEVGDSFYYEGTQNSISGSVSFARKRFPDREYVTRKEGTGVRVWRTK